MCHEWRSNIWIILELIISGVALWTVLSFLCYMAERYVTPHGYDTTDILVASIQSIPPDNPTYIEHDSLAASDADLRLLVEQIRVNPHVEAVSVGNNAAPYFFSYYGGSYLAYDADSLLSYSGNCRTMTPETFRIFRIEGAYGETTDQLAALLEQGEHILSTVDEQFTGSIDYKAIVGTRAYIDHDSTRVARVGAIACGLRRNDFEPLFSGVCYRPMPDDWSEASQVIIRVRPGESQRFVESLTAADLRLGNIYLTELESLEERAKIVHTDYTSMMTLTGLFALFLLVVIFLGILGTFWFRVQQRVGEIAVRMVNGATRQQVFNRLVTEGLLLLAIATPVIALLCYLLFTPVTTAIIECIESSPAAIIGASVATVALTALVIVVAVWFPASKAMKIDPASALKDL